MSSSYSTSLRVELIGDGDQAGTWGTTTDNNFAYIFDAAIAGYQTVSVTAANQALTYVNGPTSTVALNQSVYAMLRFTTTTGAAFSVFAPPVPKTYIIYNNSGYTMSLKVSDVIGSTTPYAGNVALTISNGNKILVWSDGVSFYDVQAQNLTGTLAIANGGTGQTTANAAFNALVPVQTSANGKYLKSDGTNTSWDAIDISTSDVSGVLLGANGGTGVANTGKTVTLGGNLTTSGAFATTLTATATTAVTLPTTGTLATLAGTETLSNKTLTAPILGTPTSGTMTNVTGLPLTTGVTGTLPIANGGTGTTSTTFANLTTNVTGILPGANGGTGVANTSKTITLGGNLTTSGAFATTLTSTNTTSVTLPTTGTLATLAGTETLTNKTLTSPTLTSPALGTPSSGNLSNCTFPTLNQNTTGTAAGLSATLAVASGGTGVTTAAAIASLVGNLLYPVGSMYSNASNGTNPATLLGFGTWAAIGMGRVLIGQGTNGPNTFTAGATGGAFDSTLPTHTHTATSTVTDPGHNHTTVTSVVGGGGLTGGTTIGGASASNTSTTSTTGITVATSIASSGSSGTNANLPPYIVVYMWQRTA